jgi:hypothetical protein
VLTVVASTETLKDDAERFEGSNCIVPLRPLKWPVTLSPKFFIVNFISLPSFSGLKDWALRKEVVDKIINRVNISFIINFYNRIDFLTSNKVIKETLKINGRLHQTFKKRSHVSSG